MKKERKHSTLMLTDEPDLLIKTLCAFKDSQVNIHLYKEQLQISMKRKSIHIKTAHTYFYIATTFGLLVALEGQLGFYRLSETGNYLCELISQPLRRKEYVNALQSILLSNPSKGHLFREFLEFIKFSASTMEVYKEFQPPTGKTLIAWGIEAGLVAKRGDYVSAIELGVECKPNLNRFWEVLLSVFNKMQKPRTMGVKRLLVAIDELRLRVMCALNFNDIETFNKYLEEILGTKFKPCVVLYGAPSHMLSNNDKTFNYNGMIYAFISLTKC